MIRFSTFSDPKGWIILVLFLPQWANRENSQGNSFRLKDAGRPGGRMYCRNLAITPRTCTEDESAVFRSGIIFNRSTCFNNIASIFWNTLPGFYSQL